MLCAIAPVSAQDSTTPVLKPLTPLGCFSSSDPLEDQGSWTFQSAGYCQTTCVKLGKPVMGTTKGSNCWCGDLIPAANSKVADSKCNTKCNGYGLDFCKFTFTLVYYFFLVSNIHLGGGQNTWSVQLTGVDDSVSNVDGSGSSPGGGGNSNSKSTSTSTPTSTPVFKPDASTTPDSTTNGPASVIITHASTIVVTASGKASSQVSSSTGAKAKGTNTAGIAAGVVVGVVATCAIAGGLFFFLRNRKRRAIEEEFHRNSANPLPTTSNMSDSRLEPSVMMQRRQSDGSIADNRDYSRRILKVSKTM